MTDIVIIATRATEMGSPYYRKLRYGREYRIGHRADDGDRSGRNLSGALNQSAVRR